MRSVVRRGTKIKIIGDTREGKPANGKTGKVVGFLNNPKAGIFFREDGSPIGDEQELKEVQEQMDTCLEQKGIVAYWEPDIQEFPEKKCFITYPHLVYELEDGTRVDSTYVQALPLSPKVRERLLREVEALLEKTGCPEKERKEFLAQYRQFLAS